MSRSRKVLWALAVLVVGYIGLSSLPSGAELLSGARDTESQIDELRERIALADQAATDPEFTNELEHVDFVSYESHGQDCQQGCVLSALVSPSHKMECVCGLDGDVQCG